MMVNGILNFSLWQYVLVTVVMMHVTIIGVTIFLHRSQAHRSVVLHPIISHFFRFWLWLTTGMITKEWVAIHRKHHATTEQKDDPHSPIVVGIKKVLLEGAELYRAEAKNQETIDKYGFETPDDWVERHIYAPHNAWGLTALLFINIILFGIPGVTIWALQMMNIPFFAAGVINGIGHYWGYRNFECPDASRNILPWGILMGGEELHNNHHAFASSAKLSNKWWEFDIGWFYIRLMSFVGLARVKKIPPKLVINPEKKQIDLDTLRAVVINRFEVMSQYAHEVIYPVLKEERKRAGNAGNRLFRHAKRLLIREESLLNQQAHMHLKQLLENRKSLETIYQYRLKLQAIWTRTTTNQKELIEALQNWCRQAEATGIEALQHFAMQMRWYVPQAVVAQ